MDKQGHIPTKRGDALILLTDESFTTHAVGPVVEDGQQDFHGLAEVKHFVGRDEAVAEAKALVKTGGRIYFRNIDTRDWSEISN